MILAGRWFPRRPLSVYWVPAIEDVGAVTRSELDAGCDLTAHLAAVNGFARPGLWSRFVSKIRKRTTIEDASIDAYGRGVLALLNQTREGFIVTFPNGDVARRKMHVYPVTLMSACRHRSVGTLPIVTISLAVMALPRWNLTVPAG